MTAGIPPPKKKKKTPTKKVPSFRLTVIKYHLSLRKKVYIAACGAMSLGQATGWEELSQRFKKGGAMCCRIFGWCGWMTVVTLFFCWCLVWWTVCVFVQEDFYPQRCFFSTISVSSLEMEETWSISFPDGFLQWLVFFSVSLFPRTMAGNWRGEGWNLG